MKSAIYVLNRTLSSTPSSNSSTNTPFKIFYKKKPNIDNFKFDIKTAFLYATLDKPIYMKQPEGFIVPGKEDHVCLLEKSLYGLKQAPRLWQKRLDAVLIDFVLKNSTADKCIYIRRTSDEIMIVMIHVDDGIAASNKPSVLDNIGTHIGSEFQMHSVPPTRFIGLNIHRDRHNRKIFLSQSHMIEKLSSRFGMLSLFPKSIPADPQLVCHQINIRRARERWAKIFRTGRQLALFFILH